MPYKDPQQQREFQRQRVAERRQKWLATNGPCIRCGSSENLQVDHVDPATKVDHKVWSWAEERRLAELEKCQVLCQPCHALKTRENHEQVRGEKHGHALLTAQEVIEARHRFRQGERMSNLAVEYGVFKTTMVEAIRGTTWQHLPDAVPFKSRG